MLSSSAPDEPHEFLDVTTPTSKQVTMPRNMPRHRIDVETTPTEQYQTVDSGIVDPPLETTPPSNELPTNSPLSEEDVFVVKETEEIDFERAPIDFPLNDKRRSGPDPRCHRRPSSFLALESDSDSDTVTDKYFGSITEGDDELTSPDDVSAPPLRQDHTYMNVTLKKRVETTPSFASIFESSIDSSVSKTTAPPIKPPRRKKKLSKSSTDSGKSDIIVKPSHSSSVSCGHKPEILETSIWQRSHSDGTTRQGSEKRRPPPPPPSKSEATPISPLFVNKCPSDSDLLSSVTTSSPPLSPRSSVSQEHGLNNRNSSLLVNRDSCTSNLRCLTLSSPREPTYSFDWSERSMGASQETTSLPLTFSTGLPYCE